MEMMNYVHPVAWDDKGMDWSRPDAGNVDYLMAIRGALLERCAALHTYPDAKVYKISPFRPVTRDALQGVIRTILRIVGDFVNLGWTDYAHGFADFPRMWSYNDLVGEGDSRLYERAKPGELIAGDGRWLKSIRNALDKLTVIRAGKVLGTRLVREASIHDPPFDESISTAMETAFEGERKELYNAPFPNAVYAWSGNTHWNLGDPDGKDDEKENGYCGYAYSSSYTLRGAVSWLKGAAFDIFAAIVCERPSEPPSYAQVLDSSIFDPGDSGLREGLSFTDRVRVVDAHNFKFTLGAGEVIPRNEIIPVSIFDDEGYAVERHGVKRGWYGRSYGFLDYGVEGGFKFRRKEEA